MWVFAGGDHYVLGVPARDLTDEEWKQLPDDDRERAKDSGLYKHTKDQPAAPAQGVSNA